MKVSLVTCGAEGLGLEYVSAALKLAGHQTALAFDPTLFDDKVFLNHPTLAKFFDLKKETVDEVIRQKPGLVCVSVTSDVMGWAHTLATEIKKQLDVPIIFGGMHPTFVPEEVLKYPSVDMVCVGEGEYPIVEVADSIDRGDNNTAIPNIWFKKASGEIIPNSPRSLEKNLDLLPFPDRTIFEPYVNVKDSYLVMTARGCVYSCSFCYNNSLKKIYKGKGLYLRRRSVENVIKELVGAKKRYGFKFVKFYDDIFTYDLDWLKRFRELYLEHINLPYFCLGHPHFMSEDVVKILKETGCKFIQIGIQSFNAEAKKNCNRNESQQEIEKMVQVMDRYKLKYELDHIFGLPGDDEESYLFAGKFYADCKSLLKINTNLLSLIPTTSIVNTAMQQGMITESDLSSINAGNEGCRTTTGSERDPEKLRMYMNYIVFFKIMAALPKWLRHRIIKYRWFRFFGGWEPWPGYVARMLVMDTIDKVYLRSVFGFLLYWCRVKWKNMFLSRRKAVEVERCAVVKGPSYVGQ